MEIDFPIEFVVFGTPISLSGSADSKKAWKQAIKEASFAALPEMHFWYEGPVAVTLYYFPAEPMQGDVDNIIKMTLDALSKHILKDDHQVERIVVQRFNPDSTFSFTDSSEVLEHAITSLDPALYIRISSDPCEYLQ